MSKRSPLAVGRPSNWGPYQEATPRCPLRRSLGSLVEAQAAKKKQKVTIVVFGRRIVVERVELDGHDAEQRALELLDTEEGSDTDWHVLPGWAPVLVS